MNEYRFEIKWSDEDECYIGSFPSICGKCCHGNTIEDVKEQLKEIYNSVVVLIHE